MAGLAAAIPTLGAPIWAAAGQVAAIAGASAAAISTINTIKFAEGGVVPGASFSGDKVPAFVNSGELILNRQQQNNMGELLYNLSNNPGKQSGGNNGAMLKKLDAIEQAILKPGEIRIKGDLARGTYNKQKNMLRNGEISTRGRA